MAVVFAILLFSFLIFIHEFGHFIAAKLFGVQVNEFSMFMGPALVKWKKGETQYSIRCIPIGGYCAMEGENEDTDSPRSFMKAAWWKRLIILLAGVFMNFVVGVLITGILYIPVKQVVLPTIASFDSYCTVNGENGLQVGDRFFKIDGERIYTRSDVNLILSMNPGDIHDIVVIRGGEKVSLPDFQMQWHGIQDEDGVTRQYVGIGFTVKDADLPTKLDCAWKDSCNILRTVRLSLKMILTGQAGISDVTGPVGIVQMMSQTAKESESAQSAIWNLLYFASFLAINLAVMNLLPIPALDGGRVVGLLLTTAAEKITRKKINPKIESYIHGVGMVILLVFMALILFKDIFVIFKR